MSQNIEAVITSVELPPNALIASNNDVINQMFGRLFFRGK